MIDADTFTTQAQALLPALYHISRGILRAEADAQDAVQQGLTRAWARRDTVQPDKLRPWLMRIVINECRNIQRHRMRVTPVERMPERAAWEPPDLDVSTAIHALPDKWRVPFLLKYAAQYKEREIAQALRVPQSTVKSRLHCARRALRQQLSDREVTFE